MAASSSGHLRALISAFMERKQFSHRLLGTRVRRKRADSRNQFFECCFTGFPQLSTVESRIAVIRISNHRHLPRAENKVADSFGLSAPHPGRRCGWQSNPSTTVVNPRRILHVHRWAHVSSDSLCNFSALSTADLTRTTSPIHNGWRDRWHGNGRERSRSAKRERDSNE